MISGEMNLCKHIRKQLMKDLYKQDNISFEFPMDLGYISRGGHQEVSFMFRDWFRSLNFSEWITLINKK